MPSPPDAIKLPIPQEPILPTNLPEAHKQIRDLHNSAFILKQNLDSVLLRLFNAGIP